MFHNKACYMLKIFLLYSFKTPFLDHQLPVDKYSKCLNELYRGLRN
jgi:hypothetical protein